MKVDRKYLNSVLVSKGMEIGPTRVKITPLIGTVLGISFAIAVGAVLMGIGSEYVSEHASFAIGESEVQNGCDGVRIEFVPLEGKPFVCTQDSALIANVDNGPSTVITDIHARVVGSGDIINRDRLLKAPLLPNEGIRLEFPLEGVGRVQQLKLTPKIIEGQNEITCSEGMIVAEQIGPCEQ